ncbi:SAM-dependent methyltransferase (plasmid) [Bacillus sp. 31A1R]|uniref:SAM-dependent methyltransferase n=1 Tax=Robertmurraya mangrovi TaxID=3098077 RepID=A0ABU5IV30_9BACI|nr:SAM-dependent methyltransferase [Bacillus sp. 31A1R]MDZ5471012.1 SAM-dependent methyltransferase [Bacillus sp. 31A1R]
MQNFLTEYILGKSQKMITYAEYISLALYHPEYGYYMRDEPKIGREGDFITTSNISDMYGRMHAKWFASIQKELSLPPVVCEIGAGTGRFAKAFIDEWKEVSKEELHYYIIEQSPYHQNKQREMITFNESIKQVKNLDQINPFSGLIFSNELFDAFPVHVVERRNHQLMEVMVTFNGEELIETFVPLENEKIKTFLINSKMDIKNNQRIEIPLAMDDMLSQIAKILHKGLVLTIDYGYSNEEWMEPSHRKGSLRGYYKHQLIDNVLVHPGEMDITSHVHFDSLIDIGQNWGLDFIKQLRQDEYLISLGILEELQNHFDPNPFSETSRRNRAIRSLITPGGISSFFQVILQEKGLDHEKAKQVIRMK